MSSIDDGLPGGALLAPLELGYRLVVAGRERALVSGVMRSHRLRAQVISVGNLVVGGAGKTPLVIALAQKLVAQGRRVAVLSRGYRSLGERGVHAIAPGQGANADPRLHGDEAVLVSRRVPQVAVLSGADRVVLGQRAIDQFAAETLLLDDGFQHRRLQRDLDIVVLRAPRPFGNGRCLPRGPLREPLRALHRAQVLVLNTSDGELNEPLPAWLTQTKPVLEVKHQPSELIQLSDGHSLPLQHLAGTRVTLVSAIARPEGLRSTVQALGARVISTVTAADHHSWPRAQQRQILVAAQRQNTLLVTTEKDAVKWTVTAPELLALRIECQFKNAGWLQELLDL